MKDSERIMNVNVYRKFHCNAVALVAVHNYILSLFSVLILLRRERLGWDSVEENIDIIYVIAITVTIICCT